MLSNDVYKVLESRASEIRSQTDDHYFSDAYVEQAGSDTPHLVVSPSEETIDQVACYYTFCLFYEAGCWKWDMSAWRREDGREVLMESSEGFARVEDALGSLSAKVSEMEGYFQVASEFYRCIGIL